MLKVNARHVSLISLANIDDFDVGGLLVFIFVKKALDLQQNAKGHWWSQQKVLIVLMFLSKNSESVEKALDVEQNENAHMYAQNNYSFSLCF